MINDFLSLTRLEQPHIQLHKGLFDLHALVEEVVADAILQTDKHNIKIEGCHLTIQADREKMGQVLANLLSNAVKYSPEGGTITLGCEKGSGTAKIFVRDQGIGINRRIKNTCLSGFTGSKTRI